MGSGTVRLIDCKALEQFGAFFMNLLLPHRIIRIIDENG